MLVPLLLSGIAFIIGFEAYLSPFVNYSPHAARRGRRNLRISSKIQPSYNFRYMLQAADSIAAYSDSGVPFDEDFAESISKPLPKWYLDSKTERENIIREVEKNRERIIQEFKAKYEITDELKAQELQERWTKIESRARKSNNWFDVVKKKFSTSSKEETEGLSSDLEYDEMKLTTKEKWEKFWDEEEKQTGFSLPGFFEVFPELKFKWPNWSRRKDGSAIECETDSDCPFPQACCPHPIIPGIIMLLLLIELVAQYFSYRLC